MKYCPYCGKQLLMTAHYFKATKKLQTVGTAFKVCTLIFVNLVAGILMLCENNAKRHKTKNTLS